MGIAQAIQSQNQLKITYMRKDGSEVVRSIEPVGLLFSEYYFYVMAFIADKTKRAEFEKANDPYPTVYRLDRIKSVEILDEKFDIPYKDRFKEGEYKNRNVFMYGGIPQTVEFIYSGPAIESVLDRLPTAEVKQNSDGRYTVKAETFGKGILMWLLSQGSKVQVLQPSELKEQWTNEINAVKMTL